MKILLTGANGFLGSHLVSAFLARGHHVRALIRPAAKVDHLNWPIAPFPVNTPNEPTSSTTAPSRPIENQKSGGGAKIENQKSPSVEIFRTDLRAATPASLAPAFQDIDALVHLAAAVTGSEEDQFVSTVIGTERLLAAMAQSPTKRLVLASSFSVYNWSKLGRTLTESSPLEDTENLSISNLQSPISSSPISNLQSQISNSPDPSIPQSPNPPITNYQLPMTNPPHLYLRDGYAIAKVWQEKLTRDLAAKNNWDLTILRPGFIWGHSDAGDNAYLACLGQPLGPFHLTIAPFAKIPLTHVENCADAFAAATLDPRTIGKTLNVLDPNPPRTHTYYRQYRRAQLKIKNQSKIENRKSKIPGPSIPVPYFAFYLLTRLAQFTSKTLFRHAGGGKLPSLLTPIKFQARFKPVHATTALPQALNWKPPLTYQEALKKTYAPT